MILIEIQKQIIKLLNRLIYNDNRHSLFNKIKSRSFTSKYHSLHINSSVAWEIGLATTIFHCFLVILQIILLRKSFEIKNLTQVIVGIIFGYFTSFSVYLMSFIPNSNTLLISLIYLIISIIAIAFGIFLYLPPNIIPLAGEGAMQAIAILTKKTILKNKSIF